MAICFEIAGSAFQLLGLHQGKREMAHVQSGQAHSHLVSAERYKYSYTIILSIM